MSNECFLLIFLPNISPKCFLKYGLCFANGKAMRYQEAEVYCVIYFLKSFKKFEKFFEMFLANSNRWANVPKRFLKA